MYFLLFSNCSVSLFFLAFYILKPFYYMLVPSTHSMFLCPCYLISVVVQFNYHLKHLELFKIRQVSFIIIKYIVVYHLVYCGLFRDSNVHLCSHTVQSPSMFTYSPMSIYVMLWLFFIIYFLHLLNSSHCLFSGVVDNIKGTTE